MNTDNKSNVRSTPIRRTTLRDILARGGVAPEKIDQVEKPLPILYDEVFAIMEKEPRLAYYDFYRYMDRSWAARLLDRSEDDFDRSDLVKELRNFVEVLRKNPNTKTAKAIAHQTALRQERRRKLG